VSLRLRLLLAVGAATLVALVVASTFTYRQLSSYLYSKVDSALDQEHLAIEQALKGSPGGPPFTGAPGAYVEVRDATGNTISASPAIQPGGQSWTPSLPQTFTGFQTAGPGEPHLYMTVPSKEAGGPDFRVRVEQLSTGETLIVGDTLGDVQETLHKLVAVEAAVTAAALAAALALGWWLVRRGLKPLTEVERTAEEITAGDLDSRVPGDDERTEVGHVARALNTMLARIQAAFAERDATEAKLRRFVADASHELRTPLAAVSAYAELFDRGAAERPDDLARVMSGIQTETGRMSRLVQDLFLLARLDEGRPLEAEPVDLTSVAAEAVGAARAVSSAWPIELEAAGSVIVTGDEARIRQVVDNLLSNVRAHTPAGTNTRLRVTQLEGKAQIVVADDGPGFEQGQADRLFERFYRVDPSRSREHGGAGLGLGIVAAIVGSLGGTVAATQTDGGGATFTVVLPLASAEATATPRGSTGPI
jgi:two-component system, OmpR family, sensor kinase